MYLEDMSVYSPFPNFSIPEAIAIGWLDEKHPYSFGDVPEIFVEKLMEIMSITGSMNVYANQMRGAHQCQFCEIDDFTSIIRYKKMSIGSAEIWIPFKENKYFVSPTMIIHYIKEHNYLPPDEFVRTIINIDSKEILNAQKISDALFELNN